MSDLQAEYFRMRQALALLSEISQSFSSQTPISAIYKLVARSTTDFLYMDRTVVLSPTERRNWFRPVHWSGYADATDDRLELLTVEVPSDLAKGVAPLLWTGTSKSPVAERLGLALEVVEFMCVPILGDTGPVALLLTGRTALGEPALGEPALREPALREPALREPALREPALREPALREPALAESDIDNLALVASLVSSALMRGRVAVLEETDRLKTASFADISHEFRTPITLSLSPLEQILSNHLHELSPEVADNLQLVHRNQERLLGLIDQILNLAKLEMGGETLNVTAMPNVNRFIQERLQPFRALAQARGIQLWLALDPGVVGADLYLDPEQFDKLISNLLSNALKFTQKGHVKVGTELAGKSFALVVADTGIGISEDQLPYIFDRFRRAQHNEPMVAPGTGLGLALVKEVATRHGGEVTVSSQPGKGTSFRVRVPLGTGHLDPRAQLNIGTERKSFESADLLVLSENLADARGVAEANRDAEETLDPQMPVVLFVDDNMDLRTHVAALLGDEFNIFLSYDGEDGLEKARTYRPDVIVADQMMPRMGGTELIRALGEDAELSSTPVLLLTAISSMEERLKCLSAGADDYLVKPFHQAELKARIRNLARAHTQERALKLLNLRLEAKVNEQLGELMRTGELKRFLPQTVVDQLMSGNLATERDLQRSKVTVLLIEAVGFQDLAEHAEPEELASILNQYLAEVMGVATTFRGTVDHLLSDSLMVIFGAPEICEAGEGAWRAAQAAFAMRTRVDELTAGLRRRGLHAGQLQLRIGISSGYCTVGLFGSELMNTYTAVGQPVLIATKLQSSARPGSIVCGASTLALLEGRVSTRRLEPIVNPGGPSVEAHEMIAVVGEAAAAKGGPSGVGTSIEGRLFRREGDFWTIAYEGGVFRLKHSKGLSYIAHLLGRPRREVHVVDLIMVVEGAAGTGVEVSSGELAQTGLHVSDLGDAGALLDPAAKAAYKRRLQDLGEELEEAQTFNDPVRAQRAQEEIDALIQALSAAVGLGGRDRKAASAAEKARLNATRAIRSSMDKIGQNNAALGKHLSLSLNTGTFCSYTPDPGVPEMWTL